jgi:hypothetical protein
VANPFRSLLTRIADGFEAFADSIAALAETAAPGETPKQKRRRLRAEGRARRRSKRQRKPGAQPRQLPFEIPTTQDYEPEPEPSATHVDIRGGLEEGDEQYERHSYGDLAQAIAAYEDLLDAGVPAELMAIVFYPTRRIPYVLIVRPS